MGLAAERKKQKFGLDPRNTLWSNDTSRFGHQQLQRFGWKPGMGLGADPTKSRNTHIRVRVKDDMLGLGSRLSKSKKSRDGSIDDDDGETIAGLDVFQRILGRLNGRGAESVERELEVQKRENYISGKWGVHFVKGDVLASTWDPVTKKLKSYSEVSDGGKSKKRKRLNDKRDSNSSNSSSNSSTSDNDENEVRSKRKKKDKKDKEKKKKKEKLKLQESREEEEEEGDQREGMLTTSSSATSIPDVTSTRLSVRSRWIRQKKAALMDQKALSEIFMVRTPSPQPKANNT